MRHYVLLLVATFLFIPSALYAQQYDMTGEDFSEFEEDNQYNAYDDPNALFTLHPLGDLKPFKKENLEAKENYAEEHNDAETQFILGYMYETGTNTPAVDLEEAEYWYIKAVNNDYLPAMVALGKLYKLAGSNSVRKTLELFEGALQKGSGKAGYELGWMYEQGQGVAADPQKALSYYEKAAELGDLNAHLKVALFYQYGNGTEVDIPKAVYHYNNLKKQAPTENIRLSVMDMLGKIYAGIAVMRQDPAEQFKWYSFAAAEGNKRAKIAVADAYRDGNGTQRNYLAALDIYKEIAGGYEDTYAMNNIGYIYANGFGVDQDYEEAFKWYLQSAEKGNPEAAWQVGNAYYYGQGIEKDQIQAKKWFDRSSVLQRKGFSYGNESDSDSYALPY